MHSFETLSFYRGFSKGISETPVVRTTRMNRVPRDIPMGIHTEADEWFYRKFGVRYRSQALFVTSSLLTAATYALDKDVKNVARVIPLGPYRICWSDQRSDLVFACAQTSPADIAQYLDSSGYVETDLNAAHERGHEVMLHCERYIMIPANLLLAIPNIPLAEKLIFTGM